MIRKEEYDTALMKEALAISNKNGTELIEQQNVLIKEQTSNDKRNAVGYSNDGLQHASERKQGGQRNSSGVDKSKPSEIGNNPNYKKRDYDFSK